MDHTGIGNAVKAMLRVLTHASRQTGRTTSLLDSLKPGDRVLVGATPEKRYLEDQIRRRGLNVEVVVVDDQLYQLDTLQRSTGRTILEHTLVEKMYEDSIARCAERIDHIQERFSGLNAPEPASSLMDRWTFVKQ